MKKNHEIKFRYEECLHHFLQTCDSGTGEVGKYVTSMEGNVMVTKKAGTNDVIAKREFSDTGFVMTMYAKGVSATRTFKKA